MSGLPNGTSTRVHADALLADLDLRVAFIGNRLRDRRRMKPHEREALSRTLAGVIGACESLRCWLNDGARE